MSTLIQRILDLSTRVGQEFHAHKLLINGGAGDLSALTTTTKTDLVAALNELKASIGAVIDDTTTDTDTTWSSFKIGAQITSAVNAIVGGAPGALDTLNELAAALGDDANYAATITTALARRVSVDAQTFTTGEQAQARANIGAQAAAAIGDPDTDFTAAFEAEL